MFKEIDIIYCYENIKKEEWEDFATELEQEEMDTFHKKEKKDEIHHRIGSGLI